MQYAALVLTDTEAGAPRLHPGERLEIAFLSWACTVPVGFRANALAPGLAAVRVRTSYAADALLIDEQPGTPPWVHTEPWSDDVASLERALGAARQAADFVVLAVHWGVPPQWQSNFQGPLAEYQEALAPRLTAAGADLVLGHHAHTVYGVEAVGGGLVCYSLGNYIFHPLASPRALPLDAPSRPYHAPERPENRDSFVATFTFAPAGGRLALQRSPLRTGRARRRLGSHPAARHRAPHRQAPESVFRLATARRPSSTARAWCGRRESQCSDTRSATQLSGGSPREGARSEAEQRLAAGGRRLPRPVQSSRLRRGD